jgi:putative aldouronate transport system permease protein
MQQPSIEHSSAIPSARRAASQRTSWIRIVRKNSNFILMFLPGGLLLLIFAYLPMVGLVLAFKDYRAVDGIFGSAWAGLENFRFLFGTRDAWIITRNTLGLNSLFIVTGNIAALGLALLLNEIAERHHWLRAFYQATFCLPFILSWVIISYLVFGFLSVERGLVNQFLGLFGVEAVDWYKSPQYWPTILVLVNIWKNVGLASVIYLSGMLNINTEYYEAATLDGAGKWQQIWSITLPLLMPIIVIQVLLAVGRIFYADFGLFFLVTNDSSLLYPTTNVIDTYVYRSLRSLGNVGMAAAAGLYQSVIGFLLVLLTNWLVRRWDREKALF